MGNPLLWIIEYDTTMVVRRGQGWFELITIWWVAVCCLFSICNLFGQFLFYSNFIPNDVDMSNPNWEDEDSSEFYRLLHDWLGLDDWVWRVLINPIQVVSEELIDGRIGGQTASSAPRGRSNHLPFTIHLADQWTSRITLQQLEKNGANDCFCHANECKTDASVVFHCFELCMLQHGISAQNSLNPHSIALSSLDSALSDESSLWLERSVASSGNPYHNAPSIVTTWVLEDICFYIFRAAWFISEWVIQFGLLMFDCVLLMFLETYLIAEFSVELRCNVLPLWCFYLLEQSCLG